MQRLARIAGVASSLLILAAVLSVVPAQQQPSNAVEADRVVVKFTQEGFELVAINPLTKTLPPSDELPAGDPLSGFWYELQNSEGDVLYRRVIGNPVPWFFEGPALGDGPMADVHQRAAVVRRELNQQADEGKGDAVARNHMRGQRPRGRDGAAEALRDPDTLNPRRLKLDFPAAGPQPQTEDDGIGNPLVSEAYPAETVFSLLIPRAAEGQVLVLFSSPLEAGAEAQAATAVGRLELSTGDTGTGDGTGEGSGEGGAA